MKHPKLTPFCDAVASGKSLLVEELWSAPKALLASLAQKSVGKSVVIITGEMSLYNDFAFFTDTPVLEFPAREEEMVPSPDTIGERFSVLRQLQTGPHILLCSLQACLQKVVAPKDLRFRTLRLGDELTFEEFLSELDEMGFVRRPIAVDKGEYAVRGGLVDLFPVGSPDPYRVEFFGDEIDSIRVYDPIGQRSLRKEESIELSPTREEALEATLQEYVGDALFIFDDLLALEDRYVYLNGDLPLEGQSLYWPTARIERLSDVSHVDGQLEFSWLGKSLQAERWQHPFVKPDPEASVVRYVCEGQSERDHLHRLVDEEIEVVDGYLSSGFQIGEEALIPITEYTHRTKLRRQKQRSSIHTTPTEYLDLTPGDLVVHLQHGIGKYLGVEKEFLSLQYAEQGKLFVPLTQAHMVTKYIGAHEEMPSLHTLGSKSWQRQRARTEVAIQAYAKDLLKLHAEREIAGGFACAEDSELMRQFEEEFRYIETDDQLAAIAAVKADMCAPRPMDRLICGDVGYGKTEVAMRAAFKAVADGGKQVAVLVPTTVLALQHYETFSERMADFPVTVGLFSRLHETGEKRPDILIGTHRILSKKFENLGLVIIDEEQRFGVRVKEKLRSARHGVDTLSLSATPIPRTLYLSLMGARDLSTINTPPQDRQPIQTILAEHDDERVKEALLRELTRDGQIFYIHNRVETIYERAEYLRQLIPTAQIAVGHGQMSADALDRVFHAFKSGEANILVSTTIVENGVDIPNANTIVVERAHTFGLGELYQLRGRVGRWNRRAYAYFLIPPRRQLPEIAQKRLGALQEIGGFGGGMRVAMRDLEIRGAGNILGTEQSGHVSTIGFHFYCKLLKRTVSQLQGKPTAAALETRVEFPFDARLPEDYVGEATLRMELYQRLGEAASLQEVDELYAEIQDRFGPAPLPAEWLYHTMRLRVMAAAKGITAIRMKKFTLTLEKGRDRKETFVIKQPQDPQALEQVLIPILSAG